MSAFLKGPIQADAQAVLTSLKEGILPVTESVSKFAEAVLKVAMPQQIGNEVVKIEPTTFITYASLIGGAFVGFIQTLYDAFQAYNVETEVD